MTLDEQITLFFTPPETTQTGTVSTLHLARREAQDCLIGGAAVVPEDEAIRFTLQHPDQLHRLFATTMVIVSAVDLLAKFYAGSDKQGKVGNRIQTFAKRFLFAGHRDPDLFAEVLYEGLRNPLLHSFTFHNDTYSISLISGHPNLLIASNPNDQKHFVLGVEALYKAFVESVNAYHAELRSSSELQGRFATMFPRYGTISVWSAVIESTGQGV